MFSKISLVPEPISLSTKVELNKSLKVTSLFDNFEFIAATGIKFS